MLPPKQRFYAFVIFCLLIIFSSFIGTLLWNPFGSFVFPFPLLVAGWFYRRMFIPVMSGQTRIRLASLALLYSTSVLYFFPSNPIATFTLGILNQFLPKFGMKAIQEPLWYSLAAQILVSAVIIALNIIWRSHDLTDTPNESSESISSLANQDFTKSLKRYCNALVSALDRYDNDVNWSDRELTPLEAEVETERNNRLRPKIVKDLVAAIKRDRDSSVFVVLGDPGSGKSVSLRRLVRLLCQQAQSTGVIPVYVNLREYPSQRRVTTDLIWEFAKEKAYEQTGRDGRNFLDTYYETLRTNSRLFFIIDSFDELPSVLDSDDRSDSHKQISAEFDRFFTQEIQSCRAVIASRHFRAPVGVKGIRLILRPFRESQIRNAMETWLLGRGIDTEKYIRRLFREKPQLVPLLRNPFTAELITQYILANEEELPENLFEVFDSYIFERLNQDKPKLKELNISIGQVRDAAALIAKSMYQSGIIGLEAEESWVIRILKKNFSDSQADSIIEALAYSRIARIGGRSKTNRRFSFAHRRFAEFFVVEASKQGENFLDIQGIPTDSRWRDCLVMYCGVSELSIRKEIANYCWEIIASSKEELLNGNFRELRSFVHCLRFLTDAFRSDFNAIEDFRSELGDLVIQALKADDILIAKIGAEAIPLIEESKQQQAIIIAFESKISWICDTTLGSCQNLAYISRKINKSIREYLRSIPTYEFIQRFKDLDFSLSLSELFVKQRRLLWIDFIEYALIYATLVSIICVTIYTNTIERVFAISILIALHNMAFNLMLDSLSKKNYTNPKKQAKKKNKSIISQVFKRLSLALTKITKAYLAANVIRRVILNKISFLKQNIHYTSLKIVIAKDKKGKMDLNTRITILFLSPLFLDAISSNKGLLLFSVFFLFFVIILGLELSILLFSSMKITSLIYYTIDFFIISVFHVFIFFAFGLLIYQLINLVENNWISKIDKIIETFQPIFLVFVLVSTTVFLIGLKIKQNLEMRKMNVKGLSQSIDIQTIYDDCLEYKFSIVRENYLKKLRFNHVNLRGEYKSPPVELLKDKTFLEELAKLREQWYELSS